VFSLPTVKNLLSQYTLVQLYTDVVPKQYQPTTTADENKELQRSKFGNAQLPLYVILRPTGKDDYEVVSQYEEGKINDVDGFMQFLAGPLTGQQQASNAQAMR
jgi:hypothetical protein